MLLRRFKLRAPTILRSWIVRESLIRKLRPDIRVLTIVAGPGYGKTVLAGQLAEAWAGPTFWYTCDDVDADLAAFSAHVHAMIVGGKPRELELGPFPSALPKQLGAAAADALAALSGALVVFDDVHLLGGASLAAFVDIIDRASASGVSFVVSGRELPLALHAPAIRGTLATIAPDDLTFADDDSRSYLIQASDGRLGAERVEEFVQRIGGWPAGLALAASMPAHTNRDGPPDASSLDVLFDYLAAEVLDALTAEERRFLLVTSILDELEVDLCDAVAQTSDAQERLTRLARRGLFIARSRLDAFESHRLFAAVLRDRLHRESNADTRAELHDRAAAQYARRGDEVKAIEHQVSAGRLDDAAEALAQIALALYAGGRITQLDRLLSSIGLERVNRNPILAVARGRLQHAAGSWDVALATLARAELHARTRELPDVAADAVRAMAPMLVARGEHERLRMLLDGVLALPLSDVKRTMVSITLGAFLLDRGRFDEVLELYARIGPAVADLEDLALHGIVLHNTGVAHMRRGDPFPAIAFYERALEVKRSAGQRVSALVTLGNLCVAQRALGDVEAAGRVATQCLREARAVGDAAMLAHALENAGTLALGSGDLETAAAQFGEACSVCDPSDTLFLPDALHGTANVALALGDVHAAEMACARSAALLRAAGDEQRRAAVLCTRGRAALAAADPNAALSFAREALELSACGADALATASVGFEVAALATGIAGALPPDGADEARGVGRKAARRALLLAAERDYAFLERSRPVAVAAARSLAAQPDPAAELRIELLGAMRVYRGGVEVPATAWKRRKARDILAYLICERSRPVPRTRLVDTFWPDSDADSAGDNLRVSISAIRRAVGDVVRFDAGNYRFEPPPGTTIDLDALESAVNRARRSLQLHDQRSARAAYIEALDAYRSDFLDGLEDGTWHLRERDRLRALALEAARAIIADPDAGDAIRVHAVDRHLALTPFDIDAMRARLESLAAARRIGEARSEYERWQRRYTETFGDAAPEFWQPPRLTIAPRAS